VGSGGAVARADQRRDDGAGQGDDAALPALASGAAPQFQPGGATAGKPGR